MWLSTVLGMEEREMGKTNALCTQSGEGDGWLCNAHLCALPASVNSHLATAA